MSRMIQINELIVELLTIRSRFGNTCCHISGLAWGAVALWNEAYDDDDLKPAMPEWMEYVGFVQTHPFAWRFAKNERLYFHHDANVTQFGMEGVWNAKDPTRGCVRRVCRAFGHELRAPGDWPPDHRGHSRDDQQIRQAMSSVAETCAKIVETGLSDQDHAETNSLMKVLAEEVRRYAKDLAGD